MVEIWTAIPLELFTLWQNHMEVMGVIAQTLLSVAELLIAARFPVGLAVQLIAARVEMEHYVPAATAAMEEAAATSRLQAARSPAAISAVVRPEPAEAKEAAVQPVRMGVTGIAAAFISAAAA
ncbi:MAG: hypothetical protein LKM41_09370 [Lachnospiraceae bacterium]|jgi:hypothetical protein|nr:hypothetical protein [Lachnospiraceae bacterium]